MKQSYLKWHAADVGSGKALLQVKGDGYLKVLTWVCIAVLVRIS